MSVENLKDYLIENPEEIIKVLELTDFHSISFFNNKREIRCAYYDGGNPTSVSINCETLQSYVFSKGIGGDLFYIISIHNDWNIHKTIEVVTNILNIKDLDNFKSPFIFNGFYKHIKRNKQDKSIVFPLSTLDKFINHPNIRFVKDNISFETQYKFHIKYDPVSQRIVVPWFNHKGELVGITGRYNFNNIGSNPKWKALESFPKGNYLYGMYENLEDIKEADYVIIGESEKFVMQLDSYGYHNGLALGGCNISDMQARLIKSLPVDKIIIALDEGLNLEHVLEQADKLKGGIFNSNKEIYVIFNNDYNILPKGSKMAPTDAGKENFEILLKKYCYRKE